jgi:intein/homing endonuclease
MTETEKAWLAGLFDGEGCVWCRWPKRTNVIVEIKMTHKATIQRVNKLCRGRFAIGNLSLGSLGKKDQWRWSLDTNGARYFLKLVGPYLVTKKREAIIALASCTGIDAIGTGGRDTENMVANVKRDTPERRGLF